MNDILQSLWPAVLFGLAVGAGAYGVGLAWGWLNAQMERRRLRSVCCVCGYVMREGAPGAPTSHGYCRPCYNAAMSRIDQEMDELEEMERRSQVNARLESDKYAPLFRKHKTQ